MGCVRSPCDRLANKAGICSQQPSAARAHLATRSQPRFIPRTCRAAASILQMILEIQINFATDFCALDLLEIYAVAKLTIYATGDHRGSGLSGGLRTTLSRHLRTSANTKADAFDLLRRSGFTPERYDSSRRELAAYCTDRRV
jgi:hypothetical protein